MAETPAEANLLDTVARMHGSLVSLAENFDNTEIRPLVDTTKELSPREFAVSATYLRTLAQVRTLAELNHGKHHQAVASIARSIFELSVDLYLIDIIDDGAEKYSVFSDAERLRSARRIVAFYAAHQDVEPSPDLAIYENFIANHATAIEAKGAAVWPNVALANLKHWSQRDLRARATLLGSPFDEIYDVHYAKLSWFAHPGVGVVASMNGPAYLAACGDAFGLAVRCYRETLRFMIRELALRDSDPLIDKKLEFTRMAPFADSQADALALRRSMLGY